MNNSIDKVQLKKMAVEKCEKLKGQKHNQGINDCNMLFMEMHEPELADKMRGKYSTIKEGCKLAKELTGYSSVRTFLKKSDDYIEIDKYCDIAGDVIVFTKSHDVYISLGRHWFGYLESESGRHLGVAFKNNYCRYKIYRKVK